MAERKQGREGGQQDNGVGHSEERLFLQQRHGRRGGHHPRIALQRALLLYGDKGRFRHAREGLSRLQVGLRFFVSHGVQKRRLLGKGLL